MDHKSYLKQFISDFIAAAGNKNMDSLLSTLADESKKLEDLSIAVTDQLTISTASEVFLDKRLAELGITRPSDLGVDDLSFRLLGIQVNAQKQITDVIHTILSTFYGDEVVRASTISSIAAPYDLETGDDLVFTLEDGTSLTLTIDAGVFENPSQVQAEELVDVITRFIRSFGYDGYAQVFVDMDSGEKFVRIFAGAKGPYSFVQIMGGKVQNKLEFPTLRGTELPLNTTVWEITRNAGSRHRFRWASGPQPLLDKVLVGDRVMIYGNQFESIGISGTFEVVNVRPSQSIPSYDSGYFEIELLEFATLRSSIPDTAPPPNTISITYTITLTQSAFDDLKFFLPKKNTAYSQQRYALAWEPQASLLKVYMPATTKVVKRDLIGSAHCHLLYKADDFNGAFGHTTIEDSKIIVTSDRGLKYRQNSYDNLASGGTITYGITTVDIDYIFRENGFTHVITQTPHGIVGVADAWGQLKTTTTITVNVVAPQDDQTNSFLGPYVLDPEANYTLTDTVVTSREKILASETKQTLIVGGTLPNQEGQVIFGLSKDEQEGPVKYYSSQTTGNATAVNIVTISQTGTVVTVNVTTPHGLIPGQQVVIAGTINFNSTWSVVSVPSPNVFTFARPAASLFESVGTTLAINTVPVSIITLDPSFNFKYNHNINEDISLISEERAYEPLPNGEDYGLYITSTAEGRLFAEEMIKGITALGIKLEIVIVWPSDKGLGYEGGSDDGTYPTSEKVFVWGK